MSGPVLEVGRGSARFAARSGSAGGADGGETDAGVVPDGFVRDFISGQKTLKQTSKEQVRQRIARALFHEYGISVDDMEGDSRSSWETGGGWTSPSSPATGRTSPSIFSGWWSAGRS